MLYIIAFGFLDFMFARTLIDRRPTGVLAGEDEPGAEVSSACLIKFADAVRSAVMGAWALPSDRLFKIGRYTDCDVVENAGDLSRMHCCIYRKSGEWNFEDMGSRNGSRVMRGDGCVVFDSLVDGSRVPFALRHGDTIVLAGRSYYWFGAVATGGTYSIIPL